MITLRSLMVAAALIAALALPGAANAATGFTTGDVNLRFGPGTKYGRIAVIPAGARVRVYACASWCSVKYLGYRGWVSARYIALVGPYRQPAPFFRPPPPPFGFYVRPWWDDRHGAWYDGRRWYHDGRWYDRPTFSLYFRFGG